MEQREHPEEAGAGDAIEQAQQQELDERESAGHGLGTGEGTHTQGQERHTGPGSKPDPELGEPLVAQDQVALQLQGESQQKQGHDTDPQRGGGQRVGPQTAQHGQRNGDPKAMGQGRVADERRAQRHGDSQPLS